MKTLNNEQHTRVLHAAYQAWMNASGLRQSRLRNKRFTYGDQWGDLVRNHEGRVLTEREHLANQGCESITNNLIRQLVKTIVETSAHITSSKKTGKRVPPPPLPR
jgi:hypothetical protein